jgi:hypothetical protein
MLSIINRTLDPDSATVSRQYKPGLIQYDDLDLLIDGTTQANHSQDEAP